MRRSQDEWESVLNNYRSSGLTIAGYCKAEGIREHNLRYQIRKRSRINKQQSVPTTAQFVEIGSKDKELTRSKQHCTLVIRIGNHAVIEVADDTDRPTLKWVLALLAGL